MRRPLLALVLVVGLLLPGGCAADQSPRRYEAQFFTLFDTVTTIVGYGEEEEDFRAFAQSIHDRLLEYHQLYDIYHVYEGVTNLRSVNDGAGGPALAVDRRIVDLLLFCQELYQITGGKVDVTYGPVLALWQQARDAAVDDPAHAALPDPDALRQAALHTGFDKLELDQAASTVRLLDPQARLDVGAVAKGYAVQMVCKELPEGFLISVGGNVFSTGPRPTEEPQWVVGIQNPQEGEDLLHTLYLSQGAVVTSGDYQRYFTVDGTRYHHIIDPDTGFPGDKWRSVTILCDDSALADGLSTALFLLSREEGAALLENCQAQAMWVDAQGNIFYSDGFQERIRT